MSADEFLHRYRLMARSNAVWNQTLWKELTNPGSVVDLLADRIYRTLQHMLAADGIWLSRFNGDDPDLTTLETQPETLCVEELWLQRIALDQTIERTIVGYTSSDLLNILYYRDFKGRLQQDVLV
jgi:uncharacterized damage-inducible protein DinB